MIAEGTVSRLRPNEEQLRMEHAVRLLLNRARKAEQLADFPLADAICDTLGIDNPVAAVRRIVDDTFAGGGYAQDVLRDLILKNDLDADVSRAEAAQGYNCSLRHLQRMRARAVSAIARHLRRLLGPIDLREASPGEQSLHNLAEAAAGLEPGVVDGICRTFDTQAPLKAQLLRLRAMVDVGDLLTEDVLERFSEVPKGMLLALAAYSHEQHGESQAVRGCLERLHAPGAAKPESATRFELERLAFLQARHRGSATEMASVARSLRRLANKPRWIHSAQLAQAQAALALGEAGEAAELTESAELLARRLGELSAIAIVTLARAEVAFARGDFELAERLASGAYAALEGRRFEAHRCAALVARTRLASAKPWEPSEGERRAPSCGHDALALRVEIARHRLAEGRGEEALRMARDACAQAETAGYEGIAARAAAAVAGALSQGAAPAGEQRMWLLRALKYLLGTRDRFTACDAFAVPGFAIRALGPLDIDDGLIDVLEARLVVAIPQMTTDVRAAREAGRALLAAVLRYALEIDDGTGAVARATVELGASGSALAYYAATRYGDVAEVLDLACAALLPGERHKYVTRRIDTALAMVAGAPAFPVRSYLVDVRAVSAGA